jgi:prophage regulatory protein
MAKKVDVIATIPAPTALLPEPGFSRMPQLKSLFGYSKTTIYRLIKDGKFPAQVKLGDRASAWRNSDLNAFMRSL